MRWMVVLCVACAIAVGCESNTGNRAGGESLAGTHWRVTAWSASSLEPSRFTITADFSETSISGTSAVNTYGGSYTATDDGSFSVGDLQSTQMGGSEDAMRAESLYYDLLRQTRKYAVTTTTLTLKNEGNQDILIYQAR